jgi:hypothetical protein
MSYKPAKKRIIRLQKTCFSCKEKKGISKFRRAKHCMDGHRGMCKQCEHNQLRGYCEKHRMTNRERKRIKEKEWKDKNISNRIACNLRSRIWYALHGNSKFLRFKEIVGCSEEFLKKHIECQFIEGMSWENYGAYGWHLDHIRPCKSFNMEDTEEQKKCFHYTNLQPLWREDNISKGCKIL